MKTTDRLLILAIAAVVLLMVLLVRPAGPRSRDSLPSTGEPREVDMDLLRRRLIREELSDHEALYYR